jgi:hypothetical protein
MEAILFKTCFLAATALTGLLCGASLDQSIKQLPARHVIGVKAFSEYAKAADLKNGVLWYALLGIGAALFSITTAIITLLNYSQSSFSLPLYLAGVFAICHTFCTTQAAPLYHSQKKIQDENALEKLLNKFERIQTFRSIFIVLNFICLISALVIML